MSSPVKTMDNISLDEDPSQPPTAVLEKSDLSSTGGSGSDNYDVELAKESHGANVSATKRTKPFIVLVAVCAALGGLIFGYDIAGAGATFLMDGFRTHFGWDTASTREEDMQKGLINGLFGVGATVGAVISPWIADKYGRKLCLFVASIAFIFGASLQAGAPDMDVMFVGRIFSGMGIGGLSMCSPVYIAELAPEHRRGQLSTLWQLSITAGILIASLANIGLERWDEGWRISYGGNIIFAVILILSLLFMPESPRWLTAKGKDDEAEEAMKKIRYEDEIEGEMLELQAECKAELELGVATWRQLFDMDNKMRYRLLLGVGLQSVQQLSGINAIMFYAPTILKEFFGERESIIATFVLNLINFLSTFITIYAVERYGRVKLLTSGAIIMLFSLIANAILAGIPQNSAVGYAVVIFSATFIVGFAYSWGPVVWTVCSEMFPLRARGKATGVTTMSNWMWTTIVGAVFPIASTASLSGCFGFFACIIFLGFWMVYFLQAETANKTILEIDDAYARHKPKLIRKEW